MTNPTNKETENPRRILFVCTGNYYRSRFAEEVFNHQARAAGLGWTADSRGLGVATARRKNPGPISPFAIDALRQRGVPPAAAAREPAQVTADDIARADLVIALSHREHHPLVIDLLPAHLGTFQFWDVEDVDREPAISAMERIYHAILELVEELANAQHAAR